MATAKQRAAARRNIKKAIAANRRRGGHKSHRSSRSSAGESHAPGFAATYQHGKTALQVLSPLTNQGLAVIEGQDPKTVPLALVSQFRNPNQRASYAKGLASSIVQAWADRKLRIANALARKSVTAAAAELYATGTALLDNDLDPQATHDDFVGTTSGYTPSSGAFSTRGKFRTYLFGKYGGAGVRWVANAVPAVGKPLKKALNFVGLTL